MKQYELTVLIHPDLEMNLAPATDKVAKLIDASGGKITKETSEGKKRLAYKIANQDHAVYYYYELELPADAPRKISAALNIADEVIRYLLVSADERKKKYDERRRARMNARRASEVQTGEAQASEAENDNNEEE